MTFPDLKQDGQVEAQKTAAQKAAAQKAAPPGSAAQGGKAAALAGLDPVLGTVERFAAAQRLNAARHSAALRPFRGDEFGHGPASPSRAHVQAANEMIGTLRRMLLAVAGQVGEAALASPTPANLQTLLARKDRAGRWVKYVEKIWEFFFQLFGQRQSQLGSWLLACDRIALDCYAAVYTGLSAPRSIPSPPPFSYMATEFTPATFRRGVRLSRLGKLANPFPVVQLPYHRLVNPWTLGAVHHEVAHNIQSDLDLWEVVPKRILSRLGAAGLSPEIARTWARWHKETWADLCGLLLGGPAVVASLIDVVAGSPASTQRFSPEAVHPTPYLRTLISLELLRRMGFPREAEGFRTLWDRLYPSARRGSLPAEMLATFPAASRLVVDTICYQPYPQLGGKGLAETVAFRPSHQPMVAEAAGRLAAGVDPGILPARFLVGAARWAVDQRLAPAGKITDHFYAALTDR